MIAPIQLIDFAIDQLTYEQLRPAVEELPDQLGGVVLGLDLERTHGKDDDHPHLRLIIAFNEEDVPENAEGHIYHKGHIVLSGWFGWSREDAGKHVDNPEKLLLVNGLSMLYGIARQHLLQLTEPGPAPRLMLPSISLLPVVEQWLDDQGGAQQLRLAEHAAETPDAERRLFRLTDDVAVRLIALLEARGMTPTELAVAVGT